MTALNDQPKWSAILRYTVRKQTFFTIEKKTTGPAIYRLITDSLAPFMLGKGEQLKFT